MRIIKLTTEWDNGERVSIEEPEVTLLLSGGGDDGVELYLLLAFAKDLEGGFNWKSEAENDN